MFDWLAGFCTAFLVFDYFCVCAIGVGCLISDAVARFTVNNLLVMDLEVTYKLMIKQRRRVYLSNPRHGFLEAVCRHAKCIKQQSTLAFLQMQCECIKTYQLRNIESDFRCGYNKTRIEMSSWPLINFFVFITICLLLHPWTYVTV